MIIVGEIVVRVVGYVICSLVCENFFFLLSWFIDWVIFWLERVWWCDLRFEVG